MIVGHSRGGEGVGHASFFNRLPAIQPDLAHPTVPLDGSAGLGPYRFNLSVVAAIAPTDGQYTPLTGPTVVPDAYFLIHGSRDGDVSNFPGYDTYNRAHAVDLANPTASDGRFKALLVGPPRESQPVQHDLADGDAGDADADASRAGAGRPGSLRRPGAGMLLGRGEYREVLRDHAAASAWMPPRTVFVSQYQDPERIFLMHNQEGLAPPRGLLPRPGHRRGRRRRHLPAIVRSREFGWPAEDDHLAARLDRGPCELAPGN